jgi:hypothetical protein
MRWASIELMNNMAMGYKMDCLAQFFSSFTVQDCSTISLALNSKKSAASVRSISQLATHIPNISRERDRPDKIVDEQFRIGGAETAFFRTTFDPTSRCRCDIIVNARHATIYRMHTEEYQARCASRDLPFPLAEEDGVILFIYLFVSKQFGFDLSGGVFLRLYSLAEGSCTSALFSVRRLVVMDALGRVSEV